MEITVKVIPKSSRQKVAEESKDSYKVWVHSPPEKGKANKEVIKLLAKHLNIPTNRIKILRGEHSRNKVFSLDI